INIMLKKALVTTLITTILALITSGCASDPGSPLKRSANNKLFDRKGFQGEKRAPLYNKKYISKAKRNILAGDFDEDDLDEDDNLYENTNISQENIEMYREMIEEDLANMKKSKKKRKKRKIRPFPSISRANSKLTPSDHAANLELRAELQQIKALLHEARKEFSNNKCPTIADLKRESAKLDKKAAQKPAAAPVPRSVQAGVIPPAPAPAAPPPAKQDPAMQASLKAPASLPSPSPSDAAPSDTTTPQANNSVKAI
ncbi:MAG: hypothetical protein COA94_08570, partial [Rickettsiales bacterium]